MLNFASRKRGRMASVYLLSGVLRCGRCGAGLYGRPKGRRLYDDGELRRQYWCQVRKSNGGCGRLTIDQRFADATVEAMVVRRLGNPKHSRVLAQKAARMEKAQRAVAAELKTLNEEADALGSKLGNPGWTVARVDAGMAKYGQLIAEAEARLKSLGAVPEVTAEMTLSEAQAEWDAGTDADRRALSSARSARHRGRADRGARRGWTGRGPFRAAGGLAVQPRCT